MHEETYHTVIDFSKPDKSLAYFPLPAYKCVYVLTAPIQYLAC